jgi:hypothetical protein
LFTRSGNITRAQLEHISDAYFWHYLAPHSLRVNEYKSALLDVYTYQGLYATLVFPHYSTGQHRGRSSASGLLRPSLHKTPQLPSPYVLATAQGEYAISAHQRRTREAKPPIVTQV